MIQKETLALTVPAKRDSPEDILIVKTIQLCATLIPCLKTKRHVRETFSFPAILLRTEYTSVWSVRFPFPISMQGHHTL